jgi:hypothetical protein
MSRRNFGYSSHMTPPILRLPTRDARDADHIAIIAVAGGVYLWSGRAGLPAPTVPWIASIAVASILCGVLLWLRVPAIKWLGVLVFIAIGSLGIRHLILDGWNLGVAARLILPVICAVWMARIDYKQRFTDDSA